MDEKHKKRISLIQDTDLGKEEQIEKLRRLEDFVEKEFGVKNHFLLLLNKDQHNGTHKAMMVGSCAGADLTNFLDVLKSGLLKMKDASSSAFKPSGHETDEEKELEDLLKQL